MANVETYGNRKQTLVPDGQARLKSTVSPNTFGAQVGQSLQRVAQGGDNLAASLEAVQEMEDKALVEERVNQYSDYARERTYDPENGYVNQYGQNAVQGRGTYENDLAKQRETLGEGLTPSQQRMYKRATEARNRQALDTAIRHASTQRKNWFDDASTARLNTFADDALAMSDEPEKMRLQLAAAQAEIAQRARANGWGTEQTQAAQREFQSGVHKNVILKKAITNPLAANDWLEANRENMTAAHATEMQNALDGPVLATRARVEAERIAASPNINRPPRAAAAPHTAGEHAHTENPHKDRVVFEDMNPQAVTSFKTLEKALGTQLTVTSAHRTKAENTRVRGASKSQHLHGNAFDVSVAGKSHAERLDIIRAAYAAGFRGFGVGKNSVHIDVGAQRAWGYVRASGGGPVPEWAKDTINQLFAGGGGTPPPAAPDGTPAYVGPQYIADQVAHIEDPRLRAQTAQALSKMYNLQDEAERRANRQAKIAAERFIIANPGTDPTNLPLDVQQQLGVDGMNTLWNYNASIAAQGAVTTDEVLYARLQRLQAEDPTSFAEDVDLFDYISALSTKDRRDLQQLQVDAIKDKREGADKALTQARSVSTAMSIADAQLQAAGVKKTGKAENDESRQREAQFQRALVDRMREFQRTSENGRAPNDYEIQDMVDQLLLPILIKEPGMLWGERTEEAHVFEAPFRADNATVEVNIPYENIPVDVRLAIRDELATELGREPTEDEIKADYVEFVLTGS